MNFSNLTTKELLRIDPEFRSMVDAYAWVKVAKTKIEESQSDAQFYRDETMAVHEQLEIRENEVYALDCEVEALCDEIKSLNSEIDKLKTAIN